MPVNSVDAARLVIETLNRLSVPYMVVGSFSSNAYGVARNTQDADFVIETDQFINRIRDELAPAFVMDPQIGFETKLMTTKFRFHHEPTDFRIEVFILSDDPHDRERFARRVKVEQDGFTMYLPTAEDVIIQKLRWGRAKDKLDIADIIDVQADRLDWDHIYRWADEHGTRALLEEIRTSLPPL